MPVISTPVNTPYDTVNDVLNVAGVRLHDHIPSLYPTGGSLMENSQVFTQVAVNTAWNRLQNFLANLGYIRLTDEVILTGVPATISQDSATQVRIDWTGYYDAGAYSPSPALPSDFLFPMELQERWSSQPTSYFVDMHNWIGMMPTLMKQTRQVYWEWRNEAIYMPGSRMVEDIRIRYAKTLPKFLDNPAGPTRWYQLPIPIVNCLDALAWFICVEIVATQPDLDFDTTAFNAAGEAAAKLIMNRDVRRNQRTNLRRLPRSGRSHSGWGTY